MFLQIPDKVLDENKVSKGAMITLGLIISLSKARLGCIAKNNHFAKREHVTIRAIQNHIAELEQNGYITVAEIKRPFDPDHMIRTIVPTDDILTKIEPAKETLEKAAKYYQKHKNELPRDIESEWLDDYIANIK